MTTLLKIKKISKNYPMMRRHLKCALQSVSLDLIQGEILGLLGVNGAGKTTLVSILSTLHPPTSGDVEWNGISIYDRLLEYRAIVGHCPQHPNIEKNLSLGENLIFSGLCYGLTKWQAIDRQKEIASQFFLEDYLKADVDQVSGGYRQRFLIARTLMHNPRLVILDEPTVGLDSHVRRELWKVIKLLKEQSITVVLTTHYLDEAEFLSDRLCFLHRGRVHVIDTPYNLKQACGKDSLEDVFISFVDDPDSEIFQKWHRGREMRDGPIGLQEG